MTEHAITIRPICFSWKDFPASLAACGAYPRGKGGGRLRRQVESSEDTAKLRREKPQAEAHHLHPTARR